MTCAVLEGAWSAAKPRISGIGIMQGTTSARAESHAIADAHVAASRSSGSQYFFPKAFNDEQIAIVERLESPDVEGVVVQGPPGT